MLDTVPYWWSDAPLNSANPDPVAPRCDVAIVGAGYTGLSAAITLARAGRSVQVFDKSLPGEGASSRNGGITSGNIRPSHTALVQRFGEARATAIQLEAQAARDDLYRFVSEENIDCDFRLVGRFGGAATIRIYDQQAREAEFLRRTLGIECYAVTQAEQHGYLGTDYYRGGLVRMDIGGLHPAKLHAGMLRVARGAGAAVHGRTAILGLRQDGRQCELRTASGLVRAKEVIIATNGYTDAMDIWLRRRMVPVRSRIIATAPIAPALMAQLMPRQMMCQDSRHNHFYYRPSPDGSRILFGGRDGTFAGAPSWPTEHLREMLIGLFPALTATEITHSWYGNVAMNRDMVPRIFDRSGIRYAAGYCGSGVVWARWAGQKVAGQILGRPDSASALDFRPPKAVPFFNGTSWFMPAVFAWITARDKAIERQRRRERTG